MYCSAYTFIYTRLVIYVCLAGEMMKAAEQQLRKAEQKASQCTLKKVAGSKGVAGGVAGEQQSHHSVPLTVHGCYLYLDCCMLAIGTGNLTCV